MPLATLPEPTASPLAVSAAAHELGARPGTTPFDLDTDPSDDEWELVEGDDWDEQIDSPGPKSPRPRTAAERLVDEAWETDRRWRKLELAQKALDLDPDCVDGYIILALDAQHHGKDPMERLDQALAEARTMLRLDIADFQGAHLLLLPLLMHTGAEDEATALADRFRIDREPDWLLANALRLFRREGNTLWARRALTMALISNPALVDFFTGKSAPPERRPVNDGFDGSANWLARSAAWEQFDLWRDTPGALDWCNETAALGDSALFPQEPELIGDGPTFFLNTVRDQEYQRCPRCHARMISTSEQLTVLYAPRGRLLVKLDCLTCTHCHLLIADQWSLEDRMIRKTKNVDPDLIGVDHLVVGTMPWEKVRQPGSHLTDAAWIRHATVPFRDHMLVDEELEQEMLEEARELLNLLAPLASEPQEHANRFKLW